MDIENIINSRIIENNLKATNNKERHLKQSCQDFEAIYIGLMLKTMRATIPEDSLFGASNQKKIFQSMFDQELSNQIAGSNQSFGLGDMLYKQLLQEIK